MDLPAGSDPPVLPQARCDAALGREATEDLGMSWKARASAVLLLSVGIGVMRYLSDAPCIWEGDVCDPISVEMGLLGYLVPYVVLGVMGVACWEIIRWGHRAWEAPPVVRAARREALLEKSDPEKCSSCDAVLRRLGAPFCARCGAPAHGIRFMEETACVETE